ncbi:MAG: hypothetical protein EXS38_11830, partial [Opitutus sp.]|nr:hypothetical protein [Opitutus sp.]
MPLIRMAKRNEQTANSTATTGFEDIAIPDFGPEHADTFRRDLHPNLRADTATRVSANPQPRSHSAGLLRSERQLLANPPFNDSDWFRKDDDVRWQFGVPPKGNANFAWVQHFIHHLAPQASVGGKSPYRDIAEVAAAYLYYLCKNHPFIDGNKRAALGACIVFLR